MAISRALKKYILYLCLFTQSTLLFAQFESATVLGTIRDASGGGVPNAAVTLENVKTGVTFKATTDGDGNYQFTNERPGTYTVRVEQSGFQTSTAQQFELTINARQRVDMTLQIGTTSQNVTVTDAVALLETDSSSRGQVINPKQIVDLPLNGRNYADLTLLLPGVAKSPLENQTDSSRDASFNVNGQRSELNNFLMDGIDNNAYGTSNQGFSNQVIQANPDALAEFRVETSNYSAEYGRAAGAVINATIKSGTNAFHGEAWEFNRNTVFNAGGFFRPANGQKTPFNQNQFGAAFGGPIVKDKAFFFIDYEGFRRVARPVQFASVPTLAQRSLNLGLDVVNPLTGVRYPGGVIPASAVSPFALAVINALPAPNLPTSAGAAATNNYASSPAATNTYDKGDVRYDEYFGQKLSLLARYSHANTRIFTPGNIQGDAGGNNNGNVYARNHQAVLGSTYTISPTSILEGRLGFTYTEGGKTPFNLGNTVTAFQVPNLPTDPGFAGGLYPLNLTGFSQFGRQGSNPQFQFPMVINPKINYTKIVGRHSLKFGFEYQRINTAVKDFNPVFGSDNYTGFYSNPGYPTLPSGVNSAYAQQTYSFADFLFGARNHYELNNNTVAHLRQRMYFAYVQDDFKLSNKLTFNLGLRYEFATPQWERDNRLANFNPETGKLIFASDGSIYNRALVHPDPNNWAPRVGLAYNVGPKTVIRSAYGISWVQFNRFGGENLLAYNGPFVVDAIIDGQTPYGTAAANRPCTSVNDAPGACFRPTSLGFPNNFATPAAFNTANTQVRYIPGSLRTGYVQSWHFTVQQELAHNLLLDVGYVGTHSVGLMILGDANQARPNVLGQNLSVNQRRPIPNFAGIEEAYNGGFASYNALQAKVEKRFNSGLYFINSFTWSKAIDNGPGHLENYNGDNSRINTLNQPSERGLSSYDQPFNDTLSILYDIPVGKGRRFNVSNRALDLVIGGWGIDLINTATSGLALNITYSAPSSQYSISGLVTPRPNLVGGTSIYPTGDAQTITNWFNKAAFANPSYTQPFGNAGRNIGRGPTFNQLDFGLHKNFNLWSESSYVQFRAEAFNLLNKTNFATPGTTFGSGSFGVISSANPARQLQLALKLYF